MTFASTPSEYEAAFRLILKSYQQRGYELPTATGLHFTLYHALPTTVVLIAKQAETVVATLSAVFDNSLIGVALMRRAFKPDGGPLSDPEAEPGERVAMMELFAGAIGAFKNPSSHRAVDFDDAVEAVEIVQLADLLLRIVRRAEVRNAR